MNTPGLWHEPWQTQQAADGQAQLAFRELDEWLNGKQHPAFGAYAELLLSVNDIGSVLEIGCGAGYYFAVTAAVDMGLQYAGVDVSAPMIAIAKERWPDADFRVGNGSRLPFNDKSFGLVLCGSCLGCCENPGELLAESQRVASRYLMLHRVACTNRESFIRRKVAYGVEMDERVFNETELLKQYTVLNITRWSKSETEWQMSCLVSVGT